MGKKKKMDGEEAVKRGERRKPRKEKVAKKEKKKRDGSRRSRAESKERSVELDEYDHIIITRRIKVEKSTRTVEFRKSRKTSNRPEEGKTTENSSGAAEPNLDKCVRGSRRSRSRRQEPLKKEKKKRSVKGENAVRKESLNFDTKRNMLCQRLQI